MGQADTTGPAAKPLPDKFISEKETAARLGISYALVRRKRIEGTGPRHYYVSDRVLYCWADVIEWLEQQPPPPRQKLSPKKLAAARRAVVGMAE